MRNGLLIVKLLQNAGIVETNPKRIGVGRRVVGTVQVK